MSQAPKLLARAIKKAGNGRALARILQKPEQRVSNWKHGVEQIPDETLAEIATFIGEDPIQVLAAERGGPWARIAAALKERISAGFDVLMQCAKPRGALRST